MYIRKTFQGQIPENKIVNVESNSQTDAYSCYEINKHNTYSTEEHWTGKYWVDGKKIYKRVLYITSGWSVGENNINISQIDNLDNIINIDGVLKWQSGDRVAQFSPITRMHPSETSWTFYIMSVNASKIGYYLGSKLNESVQKLLAMIIIIEYTKTTD